MAGRLEERLGELGFSANEAKAYLALLEIGPSPVGQLMRATGLYRVMAYDVLEKLSRKGLASYFVKNGRRQYLAESPDKILEAARAREAEAKSLAEELRGLKPKEAGEKQALLYERLAGIRSAQENYFGIMGKGAKDEYLMLGASLALHEKLDAFFNYFHERRARMGVRARLLFNEDNRKYGKMKEKYKPVEVRYMPKNVITPSWISMYGDMMLIGVSGDEPMAFFIRNRPVVESYRNYFELLWKLAKK